MTETEYRDPPLWSVLAAVAEHGPDGTRASRLAAYMRTETGYAGAYRAINRMVSAGYVELLEPPSASGSWARTVVKLTPDGWARYGRGRDWPVVAYVHDHPQHRVERPECLVCIRREQRLPA